VEAIAKNSKELEVLLANLRFGLANSRVIMSEVWHLFLLISFSLPLFFPYSFSKYRSVPA